MRCQEKLNKKNSNGPDFGNYLGHLTFFFIHPAFFKILKMSLWVFLVINNILVLSFLQCFSFRKTTLSETCFCQRSFVSIYCCRQYTCVVYKYTVKFDVFLSPEEKWCVYRIIRIVNPYVLNFFKNYNLFRNFFIHLIYLQNLIIK